MKGFRYFLALQRPKHNKLQTHWTKESRRWDQSNLWDTWFRLMTIARVDMRLDSGNEMRWKFISFPGIGFLNREPKL